MIPRRVLTASIVALTGLLALGCEDSVVEPRDGASDVIQPRFNVQASEIAEHLADLATDANARLQEEGLNVRVDRATYYTAGEEQGQTVFFDDRTLQLGIHFVPGDPRRFVGDNTDIGYMVNQFSADDLAIGAITAAVNRAMSTWDGLTCSDIPINTLANPPFPIGLLGGGFPAWQLGADITHAGFVPFAPPVLGVSFPFVFIDGDGNPTDVNNDGKLDAAFWEIYYAMWPTWQDDGVSNIDFQTVALHEGGHALDQGHFGKLFQTNANGKFHFAPRAVMNAGYTGPQRVLVRTDIGGHCGIWGSWPQR